MLGAHALARGIGKVDVAGAPGAADFFAVHPYPVGLDPPVGRNHRCLEALAVRIRHSPGQIDTKVDKKIVADFSYLLSYL